MFEKRPLTKDEDINWLGIRWQPTMRCNFNCFFCLQHQYKHHSDAIEKQILNDSLDKIDRAFASGKLKWWKIIGGEFTILPLSIRDRILEIAKKYDPYLYLTTNGSNLKNWLGPFTENDVHGELLISLHDTETDIFKTIEEGQKFASSHPNFYVRYAIVAKDNLDTVIKAHDILGELLIVQACREEYTNKITDEYKASPEYKWIVEHNWGNSYNNKYYSNLRTDDFECTMRGIVIDYNGRIRLCNRSKDEDFTIEEALNELPRSVTCSRQECTKCNGQIFKNIYTEINAFERLMNMKKRK